MEREKTQEIIKNLLIYTNEEGNYPIAIAPPCLGEKNKLRIYAYGGEIGRIAGTHPRSKCTVLSDAYIKYLPDEKEREELTQLVKKYSEKYESLLVMPRYIDLAVKAAKARFAGRERSVENEILYRYMKLGGRNWCVIDMEFRGSKELDLEKGKPDLVVYDREINQFGIIELKYKNKSTGNKGKHFSDFLEFCCDTEKHIAFNREMKRRVNKLLEFNLTDDILTDWKEENPIWFGFLFVDGDERSSKRIVGELKNNSAWEAGKDICRFRYVKNVEDLEAYGLCYNDMESFQQFIEQ